MSFLEANKQGYLFFKFEHNKEYQDIQKQFIRAVNTLNPDNIVVRIFKQICFRKEQEIMGLTNCINAYVFYLVHPKSSSVPYRFSHSTFGYGKVCRGYAGGRGID